MYLQNEMPFDNWFDKDKFFVYNCNDNFIIIDNLDYKNKFVVNKGQFYCSSFYISIFVGEGQMRIMVDGNLFNVETNQYFIIMPCNEVEFLDSSAKFFIFVSRSHIIHNLQDHLDSSLEHKKLAFTILHYKLNKNRLDNILNIYLILKKEAQRPDYSYKELVIREMYSAIFYEILANLSPEDEIQYLPNSKQRNIYLRFLEILNKDYLTQRSVVYYADKLGITAKYLSFVTNIFTNKSASVVIDTFVVFKIKVLLYEGNMSVKSISEMFNFKSQSFFGRYFKRMTGMSPRNFVANYNKRLF